MCSLGRWEEPHSGPGDFDKAFAEELEIFLARLELPKEP